MKTGTPAGVGREWRLTNHFLPPPPLEDTAGGEWATLGSEPGAERKREGWQGRWTPEQQRQGVGINKTRSGPFGNRSGGARRSLTWAGRLAGPMRTGKLSGMFAFSPSSSPLQVESNGKAGRLQEELGARE